MSLSVAFWLQLLQYHRSSAFLESILHDRLPFRDPLYPRIPAASHHPPRPGFANLAQEVTSVLSLQISPLSRCHRRFDMMGYVHDGVDRWPVSVELAVWGRGRTVVVCRYSIV
uniref:Secreted protein n=1 Tax=Panagrellus redivivus TaxID=6233 RepID=A0A7E4ZQC4_PANRE